MEEIIQKFLATSIEFVPTLIKAVVTLVVGLWRANKLSRMLTIILKRRQIDETVIPFLSSIINVIIKILVIISVAGMFGIQTTSFIAMLGAAGLAIGLALQGSLAHFASGVLILLFKPYKVGDWVKIGDYEGEVDSIQIFNTLLKTANNKIVILPNSIITSGPILNTSSLGVVRLDLSFSTDIKTDIDLVRSIILQCAKDNTKVMQDPAPKVFYNTRAVSIAIYDCQFWCSSKELVPLGHELQEAVRRSFDQNQIGPPDIQLEYGMN